MRVFPAVSAEWKNETEAARWSKVRDLRRVVTGALEIERVEKRIGSALQAAPAVYAGADYLEAFKGLDPAEIFITSGARLVEGEAPSGAFTLPDVAGVGVVPNGAQGEKCQRCWMVLPEVGKSVEHPGLCHRCEDAVATPKQAAE